MYILFYLEIRSWWEVPSIAHFCSLFRAAFKLADFDIEVGIKDLCHSVSMNFYYCSFHQYKPAVKPIIEIYLNLNVCQAF